MADDHPRVLKMLAKRHRDMARNRTIHCGRLHALLLEMIPGGIRTEINVNKANTALDSVIADDEVTRHRVVICRELIDEIAVLDTKLKESLKRIRSAVNASGTTVCDIYGIGAVTAAMIIGYSGDIGRFPTKGHYATYNGTAPIEASSGNRKRHRLNPRGNRQLNYATHIAAIAQLRYPGEGRVYYDRKVSEGKSSKEAIRALKRKISDRVYKHLTADAAETGN